MNYKKFKKHIAENGITLARTTEALEDIPKGTKLYFVINNDYISSYEVDTKNRNKQFNYDFEYQWSDYWGNKYEGEFELVEKPEQLFKIKNNTKKTLFNNDFGTVEDPTPECLENYRLFDWHKDDEKRKAFIKMLGENKES